MRLGRLALEFRMELHGHKPGMLGYFHAFDHLAVRAGAAGDHTLRLKGVAVVAVKLIAMTVPFRDDRLTVGLGSAAAGKQLAGKRPESHRTAEMRQALLFLHHADDRMRGLAVKFRA